MANPYQPGPAPMPSPPPQGYGWPAQPGVPAVQPHSPYPTPRAAKPQNMASVIAAGLVVLAMLIDIAHVVWRTGDADWLTTWSVVPWIVKVGTSVAGAVQVLINRNLTAARLTLALAAGMILLGQLAVLVDSFGGYSSPLSWQGNWLAIPCVLVALAAIVLLYIASGSGTAQSTTRPAAPAQPFQPGWPQPSQAPQWPQPPAQHPQQPAGYPMLQQPSGFAQQPAYQPAGYAQPGFAPQPPAQQQQPGVFGAPQSSSAQPQVLQQPTGAAQNAAPVPQPPNPFVSPHESGAQPTVLQRPGGFGTPPDTSAAPVAPQPGGVSDAQQTILQQPGSFPPPLQAGPASSGQAPVAPQPGSASSDPQQQPPAAQQ